MANFTQIKVLPSWGSLCLDVWVLYKDVWVLYKDERSSFHDRTGLQWFHLSTASCRDCAFVLPPPSFALCMYVLVRTATPATCTEKMVCHFQEWKMDWNSSGE